MTYDDIGNMLTKGNRSFSWILGRKLSSVTDGDTVSTYQYDHTGNRVKKTVTVTDPDAETSTSTVITYCMARDLLVSETRTTGNVSITLWYQYDSSGMAVAVRYSGNRYVYLRNLQNDVIGLLDSEGTLVVRYEHDSWGKVRRVQDDSTDGIGVLNPFRYRGYYYDVETEMYYLKSRYYDTGLRRLINADCVVSNVGGDIRGYNLYTYCFNNPVNMGDPSGKRPKSLKKIFAKFSNGVRNVGKKVGKRFVNTVRNVTRIIFSPLKAISVNVGAGVGIGAKTSVNVLGVPFEAGTVASVTDSVSYEKGKFDVRNTTSVNANITAMDILDKGFSYGREHSYFDDNCTCSFWYSTFGEKSECVANQKIVSNDSTLSASLGGYMLVGAEVTMSIDLNAWGDELISIFHESLAYRD